MKRLVSVFTCCLYIILSFNIAFKKLVCVCNSLFQYGAVNIHTARVLRAPVLYL